MADMQAKLAMPHLWKPEGLICIPLTWLSPLHTKERHTKYPSVKTYVKEGV